MAGALLEAERLGFDTVQVFTKNQRQWRVTPLDEGVVAAWTRELDRLGWRGRVVAHDSYLINLASPDDALWEKSIATMVEELARAQRLGISYLVSHPGAYTTSTAEAGIERIARAYERVFREADAPDVTLCLENTAGGGSTLGRTLEELRAIREGIVARSGDAAERVGFCIDTCHALAGGYDITTRARADAFLDEAVETLGAGRIRVLHLNDSVGKLGSRVDRHAHIGEGEVGTGAFAAVVNDARLENVPKILETPKGETEKGTPWDTVNLRRLWRLAGAGRAGASEKGRRRGGSAKGGRSAARSD